MGVPDHIPLFGEASIKPRQNPSFTPGGDFGSEEYFVFSRCDGATSLRDIILMVGLGTDKAVAILGKLRGMGALLLPGETESPAPLAKEDSGPASPNQIPVHMAAGSRRLSTPITMAETSDEAAALEGIELSVEEKQALHSDSSMPLEERMRLIAFLHKVNGANLFDVLGVEMEADKRTVKRAYFRLSKAFHPDRYYGKELGIVGTWLGQAFKHVTDAFKVLGDRQRRAEYEASLRGEVSDRAETKEEHARSIFQSACDAELAGNVKDALQRFAAAVRLDPQPRYLRRATMCAVQGKQFELAEAYARQAVDLVPRDPSYLRVLADVFRAQQRLGEARSILKQALAIDTENDVLFGELSSDLAAVEARLAEIQAEGKGA